MGSKTEINDLTLLIKSKNPIIVIETHEELRALSLLTRVAAAHRLPIFGWHSTEGLRRIKVGDNSLSALPNTEDPSKALEHIKKMEREGLYVLFDFHPFLTSEHPKNARLLKDIALTYPTFKQTVILLSYQLKVPDAIRRFTAHFELALPSPEQLEIMIHQESLKWQQENHREVSTDKNLIKRLVQNLTGLTFADAQQIIRNIIYDDGAITEDEMEQVNKARYQLLDLQGAVHYEYETANFAEVGGMVRLKKWLDLRKKIFLEDNELGLDRPKGIMLVGVQGGGKSLAAKAVAGMWGVPLLRLDFGALYSKWSGETEKTLRESLKLAELMSPCVLWMDEIEKGISTADNDSGTSKRILATLLTFMQENKFPIFIVATANDISSLPPELVRKGRMDEIFFVDLPDDETRQEIFKIHLEKRKQRPLEFDLMKLARATQGFSGAEIEQAIVSSLYASLYSDDSLNTDIILSEIESTRPLSVVMREKLLALKDWADERAVIAN